MAEQLKPCPFCGSVAHVFDGSLLGGFSVVCDAPSCQATGRFSGDRDKAIAAWNRRTPADAPEVGEG